MIEAESLAFSYGKNIAVDNVSFKIKKRDIYGLVGPNGAGKSTIIKILSCLLTPDSGTARISGYDVVSQSLDARKHLGYMQEVPAFYMDMTVNRFLRFSGSLYIRDRKYLQERIDDVIELLRLQDRRFSLIGELSKGLRQRVGLARAMLHNPDVLILDEPNSGLDPIQILEMRRIIKELSKKHTILLSSHILSEISIICNKVGILYEGRLIGSGAVSELIKTGKERHIIIEAEPVDTNLEKILRDIDGVVDIRLEEDGQVIIVDRDDIEPEIVNALVRHNYRIYKVCEKTKTLEDIFSYLIKHKKDNVKMVSI